MIKRGVWLIVLLVSMSAVFAYAYGTTGSYFGYTYVGLNSGPNAEVYAPSTTTFSSTYKLPDLIVSKIFIPDNIQQYTTLESLAVEIKNVGNAEASGYIYVDISITGENIPGCKTRAIAGGSNGGLSSTNSPYQHRYASLLPNQTFIVPLSTPAIGYSVPGSCQLPITKDVTITAEVNPIGGSIGISRTPRGRILESDMSNNVLAKTVNAVKISSTQTDSKVMFTHQFKLVPGMNAFSMPLVTEFTVKSFRESTGCELFEYLAETTAQSSGNRVLDLSDLTLAKLDEKMMPGIPYFARCTYGSTVSINGYDPGPFNKALVYNGLNVVTTRASMRGLRLFEVAEDCGRAYSSGRGTSFYAYASGTRNILGKLLVETAPPQNPIVPGQLYLATCGNPGGGIWDSSSGSQSYAVMRPEGADHLPYSSRSSGSSIYRPSRIGGRTGFQNYNYNYANYV